MSFVSELERYVLKAISSRNELKELWLRECVRGIHLSKPLVPFAEIMKDTVVEGVEGEQTWFVKYRGQRIAKMTLPTAKLKTNPFEVGV
ncbi:MAG: hypothetical protein IPK60_22745 [Sandaracinaceae bacterium]|nr:hypothetical protein [Sandaracinaceae bacterium]